MVENGSVWVIFVVAVCYSPRCLCYIYSAILLWKFSILHYLSAHSRVTIVKIQHFVLSQCTLWVTIQHFALSQCTLLSYNPAFCIISMHALELQSSILHDLSAHSWVTIQHFAWSQCTLLSYNPAFCMISMHAFELQFSFLHYLTFSVHTLELQFSILHYLDACSWVTIQHFSLSQCTLLSYNSAFCTISMHALEL